MLYRPLYDQTNSSGSRTYEILSTEPLFAEKGDSVPLLAIIGAEGDFTPTCEVIFENVLFDTFFVSANRLEISLPAGTTDIPGGKSIRVKGPLGRSSVYEWQVRYPVPTMVSLVLDSLDFLQPTVPATATGDGFGPETAIFIDSEEVSSTFISATELSVLIPINMFDVPGDKQVYVVNPTPGGGQSNNVTFFAPYRPPVLDSITPNSSIHGRPGGVYIQLSGSLIYAATEVFLDGVAVPSMFLSTTLMEATLPTASLTPEGIFLVTLNNPTTGGGGGESDPVEFTVTFPSALALSISETVQYFDGFDVQMTGAGGFDAYFEVTYNNVSQPTTFIDEYTLIANVTSAACSVAGTTDVRARDTLGGYSSNALVFTVQAWNPLALGSALRLWLDGTSLVDDGTGRASQWTDMSGGSRSITQPTALKRPLIINSTALNNKPVARFDRVRQDNFNTGQPSWLSVGAAGFVNKTAYNIWVVAAARSGWSFGQTPLGEKWGYIHVASVENGPERLSVRDDSGGSVYARPTYTWSALSGFAFRARKSATHIFARVNRDAELSTATGGNNTAFVPADMFIGSINASGGYWHGDIAEIIICHSDLNYTFKAILDNMLSYKYGLPFGVPGAAPDITSLGTTIVTQYDAPFVVDVYDTGNSYTTASIVNITELPLTTTYVDAGHLQARIPQRYLLNSGGRAITVADVGGISAPKGITVLPYTDTAGPNLHTFLPLTGYRYGNAITGCTATGTNFTGSSVVYADGVACATTYVDPQTLTYDLPATAFYVYPGPILTVHDGANVSNGLEMELIDWSPNTVIGVSMWCRGDDVTLGTGTEVAQWNDKTGNARHFTQATSTKRPLLVATDANFNNQPTLNFDGVDDYMTGATLTAVFGGIAPLTTFVATVFRADTITGTGGIATPGAGGNNCVVGSPTTGFGVTLRNTPIGYWFENSSGTARVGTFTVAVATTTQLYCSAFSGTMTLASNRVAGVGNTYANLTHTLGNLISIGSNQTYVANFLDGQIAEIWASTVAPTAQDLICWANYCTSRYGTP